MRDASLSDFGSEYRPKPVPPKPDCLVADLDPALGQKILELRSDSGYLTYIITTRRMTSGELLKYRKRVTHGLKLAQRRAAQSLL